MDLIGRKNEIYELRRFYESGKPELVVVYGRRRVGKTFLIKEYFNNEFAFYLTGTIGASNAEHLVDFGKAIAAFGGAAKGTPKNWHEAFEDLKALLEPQATKRNVIFMDEMPWLDSKGSGFLKALDYFWNSWASSNPQILFIVCGSSTSWITKKLFKNRAGLHNRVTGRIYLSPFSLGECESFFQNRSIVITRYQMLESYMIFGGIPFYLDLFDRSRSFSQNVDRLCFANEAPLKDEYEELYRSLFNSPERHMAIVETLSNKPSGMTRAEIADKSGLLPDGHLTQALAELEQCDFIERYADFSKPKNGTHFFLKDPFTLFYLRFMRGNNSKDEYFWTNYSEDGGHRAWSGLAFEIVCRSHLRQIKKGLGISGVSTSTSSWRSKQSAPGAQIDLVVARRDGIINLCEMKYTKHPYTITKADAEALERKRTAFAAETKTKSALHTTLVTTYGLERKGYFSVAQSEVTMDSLFE